MSMTETHKALVLAMKEECLAIGYSVDVEYQVKLEFGYGYFDLAAWTESVFLAIEVERTNSPRVHADYLKTLAINATELLICVPTPRVRRLVKARIQKLVEANEAKGPATFVGCLPECMERVRSLFFA